MPFMGQRGAKEMEQYILSVQYIKEWHESDAKMTPQVLRLYPIPCACIKKHCRLFLNIFRDGMNIAIFRVLE